MPITKPEDPENLCIYDNFKVPDWIDQEIKFEDLPPQQQKELLEAYRFSGFRPGTYQGVTGLSML